VCTLVEYTAEQRERNKQFDQGETRRDGHKNGIIFPLRLCFLYIYSKRNKNVNYLQRKKDIRSIYKHVFILRENYLAGCGGSQTARGGLAQKF
jgi:hypothetical protein